MCLGDWQYKITSTRLGLAYPSLAKLKLAIYYQMVSIATLILMAMLQKVFKYWFRLSKILASPNLTSYMAVTELIFQKIKINQSMVHTSASACPGRILCNEWLDLVLGVSIDE